MEWQSGKVGDIRIAATRIFPVTKHYEHEVSTKARTESGATTAPHAAADNVCAAVGDAFG
jgi:hypothetical protein